MNSNGSILVSLPRSVVTIEVQTGLCKHGINSRIIAYPPFWEFCIAN